MLFTLRGWKINSVCQPVCLSNWLTECLQANQLIIQIFSISSVNLSIESLKLFFLNIQLGSTAIGIQTSEGVVLAVEKRITSPLMEPTSVEKIVEIDSHIGN